MKRLTQGMEEFLPPPLVYDQVNTPSDNVTCDQNRTSDDILRQCPGPELEHPYPKIMATITGIM